MGSIAHPPMQVIDLFSSHFFSPLFPSLRPLLFLSLSLPDNMHATLAITLLALLGAAHVRGDDPLLHHELQAHCNSFVALWDQGLPASVCAWRGRRGGERKAWEKGWEKGWGRRDERNGYKLLNLFPLPLPHPPPPPLSFYPRPPTSCCRCSTRTPR